MQTASFQPALGTPQGVLSQTHAAQFRKEVRRLVNLSSFRLVPSCASSVPNSFFFRLLASGLANDSYSPS